MRCKGDIRVRVGGIEMDAVAVNEFVQAILAQKIERIGEAHAVRFRLGRLPGGPLSASPAEMIGVV